MTLCPPPVNCQLFDSYGLAGCSLVGLEIRQSVVLMGHTIRLSWGTGGSCAQCQSTKDPAMVSLDYVLGHIGLERGAFYEAC